MRKEIDGTVYDTENATVDKQFTSGAPGDPAGYEETLYITVEGKYFIYTNGGSESSFPTEDIVPVEKDDVKKWILSH